jgi:thymidine kinase
MGMRVIVAGLDMDFMGKPFGPIPQLMAIADFVAKVHAVCMDCGDLAHFSHRTVNNDSLIVLGEKESYVPLCRSCYFTKMEKQKNVEEVKHESF